MEVHVWQKEPITSIPEAETTATVRDTQGAMQQPPAPEPVASTANVSAAPEPTPPATPMPHTATAPTQASADVVPSEKPTPPTTSIPAATTAATQAASPADAAPSTEPATATPIAWPQEDYYRLNDDDTDVYRHRSRSPLHRVILPIAARDSARSSRSMSCPAPANLVSRQPGLSFRPSDLSGAGAWRAVVGRDRDEVSFAGGLRCLVTDDMKVGVNRINSTIEGIVRKNLSFYVGITQNPARRWECHEASRGWTHMHTVVQASSSLVTGEMECRVLHRWLGHILCRNRSGGGESLTHGRPHFVYVLEGHCLFRCG